MGRHGSSLNPRINLERAVVVELDAGQMCVEPEGARRSFLAAQECSLMQISAVLPIHSGSMHQESAGIKDRTDGFAHRPTRARLAPGVLPLDGLPHRRRVCRGNRGASGGPPSIPMGQASHGWSICVRICRSGYAAGHAPDAPAFEARPARLAASRRDPLDRARSHVLGIVTACIWRHRVELQVNAAHSNLHATTPSTATGQIGRGG